MPTRRIAAATAAALILVAGTACGGGSPATPAPGEPLSIEEAIATAAYAEGPITVRGFIVAPEGEAVRFCSALLESYPPQCGQPSLAVDGIDLSTVNGLTGTNDPSLAQVQWTDREVLLPGLLEDDMLVVGEQ